MSKIDKMIEILLAFKSGKTVQMCDNDCIPKPNWKDITPSTDDGEGYFDFVSNDYRVKPEPNRIGVKFIPSGGIANGGYWNISHDVIANREKDFAERIQFIELTDDVRDKLGMDKS